MSVHAAFVIDTEPELTMIGPEAKALNRPRDPADDGLGSGSATDAAGAA